jgi:hypothetical protein
MSVVVAKLIEDVESEASPPSASFDRTATEEVIRCQAEKMILFRKMTEQPGPALDQPPGRPASRI